MATRGGAVIVTADVLWLGNRVYSIGNTVCGDSKLEEKKVVVGQAKDFVLAVKHLG